MMVRVRVESHTLVDGGAHAGGDMAPPIPRNRPAKDSEPNGLAGPLAPPQRYPRNIRRREVAEGMRATVDAARSPRSSTP